MGANSVPGPRRVRWQAWVAVCLLLSPTVYAQSQPTARFNVRGEVYNASSNEWLQVVLVDVAGVGGLPLSADVSHTGTFEFASVRAGDYLLRLNDYYGHTLYERPVVISGPDEELTIRLPKRDVAQPAAGTVSVRELQRKVAPKALNLYRKGTTALQKRDFNKAREYFQQAIAADPSFASAHNELGAALHQLHQEDKATAEFLKASQLDPDSPMMAYNLALSLVSRDRYPDAEAAARSALKLDPNYAAAHFILGFSLYKEKLQDGEAVANLEWAAKQYPRAHLVAAEILTRLARKLEAAGELRKYLRSDDTFADRHKVQAWLSDLEGSRQPAAAPGDAATKTPAGTAIAAP